MIGSDGVEGVIVSGKVEVSGEGSRLADSPSKWQLLIIKLCVMFDLEYYLYFYCFIFQFIISHISNASVHAHKCGLLPRSRI